MTIRRVSVVVPLFNKAAHVERCLESILAQTYADLQVVVVNDGSSDGGDQVVERISDPRVQLVHQANAGVSVARNRGLEVASSEWVFFLDADDTWAPDLVGRLVGLIGRCGDAGLVACVTERVYSNGSRSYARLEDRDFRDGSEYLKDYFATFVRLGQSPFSNSSFAVRRGAFLAAGRYTPGVRLTEDSDLWVRIALTTPIAMTREALATYYVDVEGNTRTLDQVDKFEVVKTLERALERGLVVPEQVASAKALIRLQKLTQVRRHVLQGQRQRALKGLANRDLWVHETLPALTALLASSAPLKLLRFGQQLKRLFG